MVLRRSPLPLFAMLLCGCSFISEDDRAARLDADGDGVTWLEDCDDDDPGTGAAETYWLDADSDGYGDPGAEVEACNHPTGYVTDATDCDDSDAGVHPGADEACNGLDDDCDGLTDDEDPDVQYLDFYADADGDGWGDDDHPTQACEAPSGLIEQGGDCDDGDASVNPEATELCDGIDNDCDDDVDEDDAEDASTWYADADGDGYGASASSTQACEQPSGYVDNSGDCDDSEPLAWTGATEACDGVDNDCDGLVDDDDTVFDPTDWYPDGDGDGYGVADGVIEICEPPSGYADNSDDCDDEDRRIHPAATETCDGVDNDCDGLVDDDDDPVSGTDTYYFDSDLDGFGDAATTADLCEAHSGYIADDTDCDDGDDAVYPGAEEFCDAVDNDCDGLTTPCHGSLSDGIVLTGEAAGDYAGWSTAVVGDTNADGYDDLLVGAFLEESGGTSAGAAYLIHGPLTGSGSLADAPVKLTGIQGTETHSSGDAFGYAVGAAGDVNADGYDDFIIGATYSGDDYTGAAYVWLGPVSVDATLSEADGSLIGTAICSTGFSVAGAGDVNDDGYDDLLVGAQYCDTAYLVLGQASALGSFDLSNAAASYTGEYYDSRVGYDVAMGGDTDGDGYGDMLIGDPTYGVGTTRGVGAAYLVLGDSAPAGGSLDTADVGIYGQGTGWLGWGLDCDGDIDGDGYDDLLIAEYSADSSGSYEGAIYVFAGPVSSGADPSTATAQLWGVNSQDRAGASVAYAGDLDGDGSDDILVAASQAEVDYSDEGVVYAFLGPVTGVLSLADADATLPSGVSEVKAGNDLDGGADTDGDGLLEFLVGSPYDDSVDTDAGAVYLLEADWF